MSTPNRNEIYRLCTSVGMYRGYDSATKLHTVAVRNPTEIIEKEGHCYKYFTLDEFQFMVWYVCHAEIITEQDMLENASVFWEKSTTKHKKPLMKSYWELKEMGLIYAGEALSNDVALYEVGTRIQPYIISIFDYAHIQKTAKSFITALRYTVTSYFLPSNERKLVKYFRKNLGATFTDYVNENGLMKNGEFLMLGENINKLLCKGYIYPVGWCTTALS